MGIVNKLLRKCTDINDALLAYRSAPLCNSKHSPAELMFNRNIKDHIVSVPLQYKSADLDGEIKPDQYRYNKLFPGNQISIFDTERKMLEKGAVFRETYQSNHYQVLFHSGKVANRNRVHIKLDHTTPISRCCLPTPMALASGGSPMFPLVVHQPASPSIWPAVQSLRRGLSTNPGATMWCVCGCS